MTILIADNDKTFRHFLKTLLCDSDPTLLVYQASNGKEALELLFTREIDLIILDILIPEITAIEIAKTLRKNSTTNTIPIIFLSVLDQSKVIDDINNKSGSIEFINKPIDGMEVLNKIELFKVKKKLREVNLYTQEQQEKARKKQLNIIVNDLENDKELKTDIIYEPSDILSGDSYSIFKKDDGSIFIYMIDGQGHGILPSLTVFATACAIKQALPYCDSLDGISNRVLESIVGVLDDGEQLAFTFIKISPDRRTIEYSIGGMYPFFIKDSDKIIELETNNIPIMNFTKEIKTKSISLNNFQSAVIFTDGIVEEYNSKITGFHPEDILKDSSILHVVKKLIKKLSLKDDMTLLFLEKKQ